MQLSPLTRRLFRMMVSIKGQVISIVVVMMLALMALISSHMTAINLEKSVYDFYELTRMADMQVQLTRIPVNALYDVARMEGIAHVEGRVSVDVPFVTDDPDERVRVRVISVPDTENPINALYPIQGAWCAMKPRLSQCWSSFRKPGTFNWEIPSPPI